MTAPEPRLWEVVLREVERHDGHGGSGIRVDITDGHTLHTVARVAYTRVHSKRPWRTFKRQLRSAIWRAQQEADDANGEGMAMERKVTP